MFCNKSGKSGTPRAIVATHQLFPSHQAVITPNCAGRCTKHQTLERSRDFAEGSASGALGPTLVISGLTIRQARRGWALAGAPRLTLSEYYAHQTHLLSSGSWWGGRGWHCSTYSILSVPWASLGTIPGYQVIMHRKVCWANPPLCHPYPDYEDDRVTIFTCWAFPERTLSKASMDKALRLNILINTREVWKYISQMSATSGFHFSPLCIFKFSSFQICLQSACIVLAGNWVHR